MLPHPPFFRYFVFSRLQDDSLPLYVTPSKNSIFLIIIEFYVSGEMVTNMSTLAWSASFTNLLSSKSPSEDSKKGSGRIRRDTTSSEAHSAGPSRDSPQPPQSRTSRTTSRPMSIVQPYQPQLLEVEDTLPELQPIFTFLNGHSKRLYTEGYFLKLNDLNPGM